MNSNTDQKDTNYGTPSRILAAVLSPWVLIVLGFAIVMALYLLYYRPRLFFGYSSYPASPAIFCTPPFRRRQRFTKDPTGFLTKAKNSFGDPSIFWTDAIPLPDAKIISIICEDRLISHFLGVDAGDSLSWDEPVRSAWEPLFDTKSSFGKCRKFCNASRYSLIHGFSPLRTSDTSENSQVIRCHVEAAMARGSIDEQDLFSMLGQITSRSILEIMFGSRVSNEAQEAFSIICTLIESSDSVRSRTSVKRLNMAAQRFRKEVSRLIEIRNADHEMYTGGGDYLQWLLRGNYSTEPAHKTNQQFNVNEHSDSTATSDTTRNSSQNCAQADIPDHLLAIMLQTYLLVSVCTLWTYIGKSKADRSLTPDPLLLVRKARKEFLFGSHIVPRDCLVAISPVLEKASDNRQEASAALLSQDNDSATELGTLRGMNSMHDLGGSEITMFSAHRSYSADGLSPLLYNTRFSSMVSMNNMNESTKHVPGPDFRSKTGSWVRRYPQGHLISLMVGVMVPIVTENFIICDPTNTTRRYGSAAQLWLPFPVNKISVRRIASDHNSSPYEHQGLRPSADL